MQWYGPVSKSGRMHLHSEYDYIYNVTPIYADWSGNVGVRQMQRKFDYRRMVESVGRRENIQALIHVVFSKSWQRL